MSTEAEIYGDQEGGKEFREYLAALRRRKVQIIVVAGIIAATAALVAIALPAVYRSTATIMVQEQEVPPDLVRSTITSFADERIQVISHQVMTRARLVELIDKHQLYEKLRGRVTTDEILDRVRKDIQLTTVNADISDRSSGRRVNATIAFTISYDAYKPELAKKVVDELVALYLYENVRARQQSVAETNAFLSQEAERLAGQIQEIEAKLAAFKRRNVGRMPDSSTVNMQFAERTEAELQRVERELSTLRERQTSLQSQLALVSPILAPAVGANQDRNLGPEEQLRVLQGQLAVASASYGPEHPELRRLQREIAALKASIGSGESGNDAAGAKADRRAGGTARLKADNPAYIVLSSQLESTQKEAANLAALRDDLRARRREYDSRLLQIPDVEREYSELTRDYSNAQTRYKEIKAKQMQAEGAVELERELKAERFSLSEPANLPQKPFKPNRAGIVLAGLFAAAGLSLALAIVREAFDPSVKGPLELARISPVPVLTPIPYIETRKERAAQRRRALMLLGFGALALALLLAGVHFFVKPLPALVDALRYRIAGG